MSLLETQLFQLVLLISGSAISVVILRWLLHSFILKPIARQILWRGRHRSSGNKSDHEVERFCESFWKFTAYCTLLATGCFAVHDQPWAWRTSHYWQGWPHQHIASKVTVYYCFELAFYAASILMLQFWEERRSDFPVMMLHHLTSVVLIVASYLTGFARVGSVIMLLHDPSDIFLEGAKMCNYAGREALAVAMFALLLVTWFGLRLVILPGWIIPSIWWELPAMLGPQSVALWLGCLLCLLVVLHAYWFYIIVSIAVGVSSGKIRDTRESES